MGFKEKLNPNDLQEKNIEELVEICSQQAWKEYEEKIQQIREQILPIEKTMVLKVIDRAWINHIDIMSKLRDGIGLRSYAQSNPLQAYVQEGYEMFEDMMNRISQEIVAFCLNVRIVIEERKK
ncbi:Protein translocase subunit SecA [bioreactor metagenome]|uniref:Protein translocase subunit SecA n=2 Tax=root TaxID=1 RepID=A0A645HD03_9ZZZZ